MGQWLAARLSAVAPPGRRRVDGTPIESPDSGQLCVHRLPPLSARLLPGVRVMGPKPWRPEADTTGATRSHTDAVQQTTKRLMLTVAPVVVDPDVVVVVLCCPSANVCVHVEGGEEDSSSPLCSRCLSCQYTQLTNRTVSRCLSADAEGPCPRPDERWPIVDSDTMAI